MERKIHTFDNGVKVFDDHLIPAQRERYTKRNVHEAEEEDFFVDIINKTSPDGCYVNIGCAIGYYPLLAKKLSPHLTIHAFEPLLQHRQYFIENIALNGRNKDDFILHEEGIAATNGEAKFVDNSYGSSLYRPGLQPRNLQTIKTKTLDSFANEIGRVIDLCQMDVQGFELDVLRGAEQILKTNRVKIFLIGTHSPALHQGCIDILKMHGYAIDVDLYDTKEQPDGILIASRKQ
ncbi:MAG: FkbM family methyltransferase [Pseudomonadota bacterium]